ncbi:hypothetical protein ONZ45_g3287 [Pleurotus djamor]|nr:hypothetical protein ONZ45_g3287 [Pleurotus djamor]
MSEITHLLGPVFVGLILSWGLYGGLLIQIYNYYDTQHKTDRPYIKAVVYGLLIVDSVSQVFITSLSWGSLVRGWGDPNALMETPWMGIVLPVFNGITAMTVQIFFAWRIWTLRNNKITLIVCSLIVATAVMQFAAALAVTIKFFTMDLAALMLNPLTDVITVWLAGDFVCDVLITTSMVLVLADIRRNAPFKRTESLMNRLIINTVETGTAIVAVVELALYLRWENRSYHVAPEYILPRLYTNVLLVALNGRRRIAPQEGASLDSNTLQFHTFRSQLQSRGGDKDIDFAQGVHISRETRTGSLDLRDLSAKRPASLVEDS